jgi:hypothetical protein
MIMSRLLPVALLALLVGACVGAPPPAASPTSDPTAPPATPSPPVTAPPTPSLAATAWPRVPEDDVAELPPIARLVTANGTVVAGELGSFAYRGGAADAPWIARGLELLEAPPGQQLIVGLLPGNEFDAWRVSYAAAADTSGDMVMPLASGANSGTEQAAFDPPPAGDWVIQVSLVFPGDDGDATYYWAVSVP